MHSLTGWYVTLPLPLFAALPQVFAHGSVDDALRAEWQRWLVAYQSRVRDGYDVLTRVGRSEEACDDARKVKQHTVNPRIVPRNYHVRREGHAAAPPAVDNECANAARLADA